MEKSGYVSSSVAILVFALEIQACTPIGEAPSSENNEPSQAGVPSPGPAPAPAPAPAPVPAPAGPDCAKVGAPTLTATNAPTSLMGGIGLGPGSGNFMPGAFSIPIVKSSANQVINTNCSIASPLNGSVTVNCASQLNGTSLRVTLNVQNGAECVSGTSVVTLRVRDDVCRATAVSNSIPVSLTVNNVCPAQQRVSKDGSVAPELTAGRLDQFGSHVAISGNWAVVTALGDDQKTTNTGAAFVYKFDGTKWNYTQKLIPAELTNYSEVDSVAIAGNLIVLGAPYHGNYGALFAYRFNGTSWVPSQGQIEPSLKNGAVRTENFGYAMAISGSSVYVGAPGYYHNDPVNYAKAGAVFVFTDSGSSLTESRVISASDKGMNDAFGAALAANGSTLVVGAPGNSKAYLFNGTTEVKLAGGLSAGSKLGTSVAIAANLISVGAPGAVNGQGEGSGAVAIFDAATGAKKQTLFGDDASIQFGMSVAANGSDLLIGAPMESINGATRSGAAHMYRLNGGSFQPYYIFRPRRGDQGFEDYFGESIDIGSGYVFGGSRADDLADSDMGSAFFIKIP